MWGERYRKIGKKKKIEQLKYNRGSVGCGGAIAVRAKRPTAASKRDLPLRHT